jgi:hypothetical protein
LVEDLVSEDVERAADRGVALHLFFLALVVYAWFFQGGGFNQNVNLDLTRAIVERGTIRVDAYRENTGDLSLYRGHFYSNKAPGLSLLAVVPYFAIDRAVGLAGLERDAFVRTLAAYGTTVAVSGLFGALIPALLFLHVRDGGASRRAAAASALIAAFATPLFAYSTMLFAHVPSAALSLAGFHLLFRREAPARPAAAGLLLGAATVVNYLCGPLAVIFAAVFLFRRARWWRDALAIATGALGPALLLGWYHQRAFGSPFATPIDTTNPAFISESAWLGIVRLPRLDALWGITVSPYRGLFFMAPILLFAFWGGAMLAREGRRREAAAIGGGAFFLLLFNASFNGWHGGYTIGPRYLLPLVPLLAIAAVPALGRAPRIAAFLAAISLAFNFAATAVDPQPPETLRNPLFEYSLPSLLTGTAGGGDDAPWLADWFTGHASVNRQTVDEILPFRRYPPGSPQAEWASFNLGELLFPTGSFASVVPALLLILGGGGWILRGTAAAPRSRA